MPSVTEEHPRGVHSARKRRRDDGEPIDSSQISTTNSRLYQSPHHERQPQVPIYSYSYDHTLCPQQPQDFRFPIIATYEPMTTTDHNRDYVSRKIMPLPSAKRQRFQDKNDAENWPPPHHDHHPAHKGRRHSRSPSHTPSRPAQIHKAVSGSQLDPCHICLRKPTKKSDLDSFAGCQGCGARTCFVCLRECQAWTPDAPKSEDSDGDIDIAEQEALSRSFHMTDVQHEHSAAGKSGHSAHGGAGWATGEHRAVVCSQCCIEKGAEGDVVCLGCLSRSRET